MSFTVRQISPDPEFPTIVPDILDEDDDYEMAKEAYALRITAARAKSAKIEARRIEEKRLEKERKRLEERTREEVRKKVEEEMERHRVAEENAARKAREEEAKKRAELEMQEAGQEQQRDIEKRAKEVKEDAKKNRARARGKGKQKEGLTSDEIRKQKVEEEMVNAAPRSDRRKCFECAKRGEMCLVDLGHEIVVGNALDERCKSCRLRKVACIWTKEAQERHDAAKGSKRKRAEEEVVDVDDVAEGEAWSSVKRRKTRDMSPLFGVYNQVKGKNQRKIVADPINQVLDGPDLADVRTLLAHQVSESRRLRRSIETIALATHRMANLMGMCMMKFDIPVPVGKELLKAGAYDNSEDENDELDEE